MGPNPSTVCTVSNTVPIYERLVRLFSLWPMFQRLEDRIKELCLKAASTPESPELEQIFHHLKAALTEHTQRIRKLAAGFPVMVRPERRCSDMPSPNTIEAERGSKHQS